MEVAAMVAANPLRKAKLEEQILEKMVRLILEEAVEGQRVRGQQAVPVVQES
tara:strand:+ start:650 stop:805 length:156 start_codon:yes stop_codon:yes gene_type:complete